MLWGWKSRNFSSAPEVHEAFDLAELVDGFGVDLSSEAPGASGRTVGEEYSHRLYKTSFLMIIPSALGFTVGPRNLALWSFIVFLTSVNYWRMPQTGFRRLLDMICVQVGMMIHICMLVKASTNYALFYLSAIALSGVSYTRARHYGKNGDFNNSTKWHASLHLIAAGANSFLYLHLAKKKKKKK
eukprot:Trichotokara_eunicae@DN3226_c0_g1_i1.p1